MTWGWGLLLAFGVVFVLVLFTPVTVELHYTREGKDDRLHVGFRAFFGLVRFGYDIPTIALMEKSGMITVKKDPAQQMPKQRKGWVTITVEKMEKWARQVQQIHRRIGKYKRALCKLSKSFHIRSLKWRTMFGTGDAADTAMLTGVGWALKGILSGTLYRFFTVQGRLHYDVKPHFQAKGFRTELTCIIRFWLGKTIFAGLTLVFLWLMEGLKCRNIRFKG